jgi:hypothetical protein
MGHASLKIRGRLLVGPHEFSVASAAIAFELNNIPTATFGVAVGRGGGLLRPANIHQFAGRLSPDMRVQFLCTIDVLESSEPYRMPVGEFRLFDGYLVGMSLQKQHGGLMQVVLHSKHWLMDMDYSSAVSESSHPLNPSQFSFKASHQPKGAGGTSWTPLTAQGPVSDTTLATDFWGEGLKKWLTELTALDMINKDELAFLGGEDTGNATAKKALDRFTTKNGNYVNLAMDFNNADASSVAAAIWNDIQLDSYDSTLANSTLWGKLINDFSSRYMFAVVPRVEDALVVPYIPGLRKPWVYGISGKDYAMVGATSELQRRLRGVGIFSGVRSRTGSHLSEPGQSPTSLGVGGWYSPAGSDRGMVMLRQGPRWLTNIISPDRYSEFSSGAGVKPIGSAIHPGTRSLSGPNTPPAPETLKKQSKTIFDAFAHAMFVYEQLRLRQLELSGKVRFDIAPGSTIAIAPSFDKFIPMDALAAPLVGDVTRVTYMLDCNKGQAATNFNLAHLRTGYENGLEEFSVSRHPLWMNPWSGCGLISAFDR